MREIWIENRLEVIGTDTIIIPGCEPGSTVTSPTLYRYSTCPGVMVKLADALAAVPGSRIEFQINNGESNGSRKKWFVLPPYNPDCPCQNPIDVYGILRGLATKQEDITEEQFEYCQVIDQGFMPPKNYNNIEVPAVKPYQQEGTWYGLKPALMHPAMFDWAGSTNMNNPELSAGAEEGPYVG